MYKYVIKRILLIIPILLGVTFVVFTIINFTPGDPARTILGATADQEAVDRLTEQLGLNEPFLIRFYNYMKGIILEGDFGVSYTSQRPVFEEIWANFPYTFCLTLYSTILYVLIGIPAGVYSAVRQYSPGDNVIRVTAMLLAAMPTFWLGLIAIMAFSLYLNWLPASGVDSWTGYIMPVGILGLLHGARLVRTTRTTMLEAIRQDYVRTARAKGAPESTVIWRHAFVNAAQPLIMEVGISFGAMMGGTVLTESVFSLPGLGNLSLKAIQAKNTPMVLACTIFLSAIYCLSVVIVDIISAYVDPRVKARYTK